MINAGNLMMVGVLLAGAFLKTFWHKILLVIVAAALLRFEPTVRNEEILFILVGCLGMILMDRLPFYRYINILISLMAALLLFNILISLL